MHPRCGAFVYVLADGHRHIITADVWSFGMSACDTTPYFALTQFQIDGDVRLRRSPRTAALDFGPLNSWYSTKFAVFIELQQFVL